IPASIAVLLLAVLVFISPLNFLRMNFIQLMVSTGLMYLVLGGLFLNICYRIHKAEGLLRFRLRFRTRITLICGWGIFSLGTAILLLYTLGILALPFVALLSSIIWLAGALMLLAGVVVLQLDNPFS
ncbi:MAG: hypothetical protein ACFFCO_12905, partial [Promethearchaeota archaeon]